MKHTQIHTPMISIVLPAYNAGEVLEQAVMSVYVQTFTDWELLIMDDGSTDNTAEVALRIKDPRIRLIRCKHDFIATLNKGMQAAKGKYIARMDADDRMVPERLAIQYRLMEEHPEITVCGSWVETFGKDIIPQYYGGQEEFVENPIACLLQKNFLCHPTVIMRADFWQEHQLHYQYYSAAEDYKLWFEMAKLGAVFYVIPQVLLLYQVSDTQVSKIKEKEQHSTSNRIRWEIIDYLIDSQSDKETLRTVYSHAQSLIKRKKETEIYFLRIFITIFCKKDYIFNSIINY